MSKIDEVRADMVKAMKAKDKDTKETLSMLLAALKNKAIDKREDLTPEEETQVILKEIKQTKETLDMTPADRTEIIEECNKRLAVLEQYAPKMMDEAEIKEVVASVLAEMGLDYTNKCSCFQVLFEHSFFLSALHACYLYLYLFYFYLYFFRKCSLFGYTCLKASSAASCNSANSFSI